jgi:hypothetical protein
MSRNASQRNASHSAQSVGDFLNEIKSIRSAWVDPDDPTEPWYRGQQRAYWSLRPSLYRDYGNLRKLRKDRVEDEIREEFMVRAPVLSDVKPADQNEWDWYFLMQHYGSPTRLLDWTDGALIGLYFAVRDNPGFYDSVVWVLDPHRLNRRSFPTDVVIAPSTIRLLKSDHKRVAPWLPYRFRRKQLPEPPIAVFPTHIARRISTQRSCFTVHGADESGLDRLWGHRADVLRRIVIPSFRAVTVRKELEACGIDEATAFPDLDGLGRALSARWRPDPIPEPHRGVFTRLRPSKHCKGDVGVFAIREIPRGKRLFDGDLEEFVWLEAAALPRGPGEVRKLYSDFTLYNAGTARYGCPPTYNRLTMPWYLKRPSSGERPNLRCDPDGYTFRALRRIRPGEELTVDDSSYTDPGLL